MRVVRLAHVPVSGQFETELPRCEALERSGPFAVPEIGAQGEPWNGGQGKFSASEHLEAKTVVLTRLCDTERRGGACRAIEGRAATDVWPEPQVVAHAARQR